MRPEFRLAGSGFFRRTAWRATANFGSGLLLAWLSGCVTDTGNAVHSSAPPPPASVQVPLNPPASPPPSSTATNPPLLGPMPAAGYPKTIQETTISSGALYLYKQGQGEHAAGRLDHALALLQRAVHEDPHNPFIWQALASTQLDMQQPDQAESAAQKSSSLGRGNPYVDAGNWRIIASARQAQGDPAGAKRAQAQADQIAQALAARP